MSAMLMVESLSMRMVWEMVSKTALKSRRMRFERKRESAAGRRSLAILIEVVSVLRRGRKPACNVEV